jgi:RecB family exonuclease
MEELTFELAPAVLGEVEERPLRLSYSSISTYENCPLQYRYRYLEKLPGRRTPALAFGEALHEALRAWYHQPVPVPPPVEHLLASLDEAWDPSVYASPEEERTYKDHAREVLSAYHRTNSGSFRIPVALEQRFEIEVDGVTVSGIIDRMDRHPDGSYEIIDYKTSRRLPPLRFIERDLQLSIYYLAAYEVWGIRPEKLTLYFLLPGQPLTSTRTPADAEATRSRIAGVAARIRSGEFPARENPLCNWCDYQALCPLFAHKFTRGNAEPAPVDIGAVVDEWVSRTRRIREDAQRLDELSATIHAYCEDHGLQRLFGEDAAVTRVKREEPTYDPNLVRAALPPHLLDRVLRLDDAAITAMLQGDVPDDIRARLQEARIDQTTFALHLNRARRR